MLTPRLVQAWTNTRGTTAVEFAIVGPLFVGLVIGLIYLCMTLYLVSSLQFAVEDGARCASVNRTVCNNAGAIVAYTQSRYDGPALSPTFTYAAAACGNSVSASVDYSINLGLTILTVPLTASACFP